MIPTLEVMAGQFGILTVVGWAAIALLPRRHRELMLPGVPLFGAAFVAVVMSTTSHFFSARVGAVALVLLTGALLALAASRAEDGLRVSRRAIAVAALVVSVSAVGAGIALVPSYWAGDNRATPVGGTLDIFYYASESDWIRHNPVEPGPVIGAEPGEGDATPVYRPMDVADKAPLRVGQAMVLAALDTVMGKDSVDTITPAVVLWVWLTGAGAAVGALLLGLGLRVAVVAALVGNGSAMLLTQAFSGNADALLGEGLAIVTISAVLAAVDRRLGIWLPALSAAALVAVYTEFAVYVAPAVACGVLLRSRRDLRSRLGRLLGVCALSLAIAPFAWTRGVATLLMDRSTAGMGFPSPFYSDGPYAAVSRFLGTCPISLLPQNGWAGYVAGGLVLVGLALAVLLRPERGAWIALLVVGAAYIGKLTHDQAGYVQFRAVQLIGPLVFFVAVVGYAAGVARFGSRPRRAPDVLAGVGAFVVAGALVVTNLHSSYAALDRNVVRAHHVDGTYARAAVCVDRHGGTRGRNVTVMNPDINSQLWLVYYLRREPLVAYPALHISYLYPTEYWGGEVDPFVLVGPGAFARNVRGAVVCRDRRFRLIRLQGSGAVVAAPVDLLHWNAYAGPDGSMAGQDGSKVLVEVGTEAGRRVTLHLRIPGLAGHRLAAVIDGVNAATTRIRPDRTAITVDLGAGRSAVVQLDIDADGQTGDRPLYLDGVSLAH